jgi:leader peptidase (prepilin peptidase)/N-methyltransferase
MVTIAAIYGLLGLVIGSFLNVVIYRVPKGESIVMPASHCPECGHPLRPWELIPVLSFMILRGKCRKCGSNISWRYPAIELLTGLFFVGASLSRADRSTVGLILDLAFISLLIVLTFIDIDNFRLPDILVAMVAVVGMINTLVTGDPVLWRSLLGASAIGGIFFLVAYFYPEGMGMGDVKLVAALGLYIGFPLIFMAIFLASLSGIVIGGFRMLIYKKKLKDPIPFGPFLAAGAILVLLCQSIMAGVLYLGR